MVGVVGNIYRQGSVFEATLPAADPLIALATWKAYPDRVEALWLLREVARSEYVRPRRARRTRHAPPAGRPRPSRRPRRRRTGSKADQAQQQQPPGGLGHPRAGGYQVAGVQQPAAHPSAQSADVAATSVKR